MATVANLNTSIVMYANLIKKEFLLFLTLSFVNFFRGYKRENNSAHILASYNGAYVRYNSCIVELFKKFFI